MANTIKSYVILRNDDEAKWTSSTVILKKGEVALSLDGNGKYSIKVGDGVNKWADLPFVIADSKDVKDWAKQDSKPEYDANEIKNLETLIQEKIIALTPPDTNTTYKLVEIEALEDRTKYQLYQYNPLEGDWKAVDESAIIEIRTPTGDVSSEKIQELEASIQEVKDTATQNQTRIEEVDAVAVQVRELSTQTEGRVSNLETEVTSVKETVTENQSKIEKIEQSGVSSNPVNISVTEGTIDDIETDKASAGDIGIVRNLIDGTTDKYVISTYVWDGQKWNAASGSYTADTVYFDKDITVTTAVGNITLTDGNATIPAKGKSLSELFEIMYCKEDTTNLVTKKPTLTFTNPRIDWNMHGYNGGVSRNIGVKFTDGTYKYGPTPGCTAETCNLTCSSGDTFTGISIENSSIHTNEFNFTFSGNTKYTITATANYTAAVNAPNSNLGNACSDQTIQAGTATTAKADIFGSYIPLFYGFRYSDGEDDRVLINDDFSNFETWWFFSMNYTKDLEAYNKTYIKTATAEKSWRQFIYAIPQVDGYSKKLSNITDANGLPVPFKTIGDKVIDFSAEEDGSMTITYTVYMVSFDADYDTLKLNFEFS